MAYWPLQAPYAIFDIQWFYTFYNLMLPIADNYTLNAILMSNDFLVRFKRDYFTIEDGIPNIESIRRQSTSWEDTIIESFGKNGITISVVSSITSEMTVTDSHIIDLERLKYDLKTLDVLLPLSVLPLFLFLLYFAIIIGSTNETEKKRDISQLICRGVDKRGLIFINVVEGFWDSIIITATSVFITFLGENLFYSTRKPFTLFSLEKLLFIYFIALIFSLYFNYQPIKTLTSNSQVSIIGFLRKIPVFSDLTVKNANNRFFQYKSADLSSRVSSWILIAYFAAVLINLIGELSIIHRFSLFSVLIDIIRALSQILFIFAPLMIAWAVYVLLMRYPHIYEKIGSGLLKPVFHDASNIIIHSGRIYRRVTMKLFFLTMIVLSLSIYPLFIGSTLLAWIEVHPHYRIGGDIVIEGPAETLFSNENLALINKTLREAIQNDNSYNDNQFVLVKSIIGPLIDLSKSNAAYSSYNIRTLLVGIEIDKYDQFLSNFDVKDDHLVKSLKHDVEVIKSKNSDGLVANSLSNLEKLGFSDTHKFNSVTMRLVRETTINFSLTLLLSSVPYFFGLTDYKALSEGSYGISDAPRVLIPLEIYEKYIPWKKLITDHTYESGEIMGRLLLNNIRNPNLIEQIRSQLLPLLPPSLIIYTINDAKNAMEQSTTYSLGTAFYNFVHVNLYIGLLLVLISFILVLQNVNNRRKKLTQIYFSRGITRFYYFGMFTVEILLFSAIAAAVGTLLGAINSILTILFTFSQINPSYVPIQLKIDFSVLILPILILVAFQVCVSLIFILKNIKEGIKTELLREVL